MGRNCNSASVDKIGTKILNIQPDPSCVRHHEVAQQHRPVHDKSALKANFRIDLSDAMG